MADKHSPSIYGPFAVPDFLKFLNTSSLADIQRRNLQALTASMSKISDAIATVASKQAAALSSLGAMRSQELAPPAGKLTGLLAPRLEEGREAMERAVTEMRGAADALRECWYGVATELQDCVRDNISRIEEQMKERAEKPPVPAPQRAKAAAAE